MVGPQHRRLVHLCLLMALILAITSRGKSWETPLNMSLIEVDATIETVDTHAMCDAFKDGLLKTGLVLGFHASLPRDDNDFRLFSTSMEDDGMFVDVNEQRQLIIYFGKASDGYEITVPDPEFISDVGSRFIDKNGDSVSDVLNTTVFLTRLGFSEESVAIEAFTSSPFLSSVVKIIPLAQITNTRCSGEGILGLGIDNSSAALEVGQTGKTSKASMLRSIFVQRSVASLLITIWLFGLWITRKTDDEVRVERD